MRFASLLSRVLPHKAKPNRFFGLMLRESSATGYALEQTDNDIEIIKNKSFTYTKNFEKVLDDTDKTVYEFETELKSQFSKILFVLPTCGLKDGGKEVVQPYRAVISEIVHNLELEAMGYIEIVDILKSELQTQGSAVYIEPGKLKTQLIFLRSGEKWKQLTINTNPANTVSHLAEFVTKGSDIAVYPMHEGVNTNALVAALAEYHVHVYTTNEVSANLQKLLKQQLLEKADTNPEASELTVPIIPETVEGGQIDSEGSSIVIDTQHVAVQDVASPPLVLSNDADLTTPGTTIDRIQSTVDSRETEIEGFKIVRNHEKYMDDGYVHAPPPVTRQSSQTPVSQPMQQTIQQPLAHEYPTQTTSDPTMTEEIEGDSEIAITTTTNAKKRFPFRAILLPLGTLICIVLSSAIAFEWYLHKVTLVVTMPTESYEVKQALSALAVSKVIEEKEVEVSVDTTGKKEVGERAKGTVTVASFDDKQASFSAGTQLYLDDSVYRLDAEVILPAATVDTASGTKQASKKSVAASATFIGTEGNIDKGRQFAVEDYPSSVFYALSDSQFSGGSQQTVSVVSQSDIVSLNEQVTEHAKQASESAREGTASDTVTLDDISTIDVSELSYSAELGEVASVLRAQGTVKAVLYTAQKNTLVDILTKALKEGRGNNFQFMNDDVQYTFSNIVLSDDELSVDADMQTTLRIFQALDTQSIKKNVRLKLHSQVQDFFNKSYKVDTIKFQYDPVIPLFEQFVPYRTENIEIQVDPSEPTTTP